MKTKKFIFNLFVIFLINLVTVLFKKTSKIRQNGFYCNDKSIMYPLTDPSIIDSNFFHLTGCIMTLSTSLLINNNYRKLEKCLKTVYRFFFGVSVTIFITTVIKGSIGRLRPYFWTSCIPKIDCFLPKNQNVLHLNYLCTNENFKINSRLSFPSGHTSFALYCATFLALLAHKKMRCSHRKIFLQISSIFLSFFVGYSRILEYKHFWSDVIVGCLIGAICAIFVHSKLFKPVKNLGK